MNANDDLEYQEERHTETKQTAKKTIALKLKSSSSLSSLQLAAATAASSAKTNVPATPPQQNQPTALLPNPNILNNNNNNISSVKTGSSNNNAAVMADGDATTSPTNKQVNIIVNSTSSISQHAKSQSESPFDHKDIASNNQDGLFDQQALVQDSQVKRNHPISNLNWSMNVSTMSQKLTNEPMDYCMICYLPILIYGRLLPCKHVMCIQCANNIELKVCLKNSCHEMIERIETAYRGQIFICSHDAEAHAPEHIQRCRYQPDTSQKKQCGRSYMSQRDLIAHVRHRHDPAYSNE